MTGRDDQSLAHQVTQLDVGPGHLAVWALGQHGFLIKGGGTIVLLDPYLSNYVEELGPEPGGPARLIPIVIRPEELGMVDVVLVTHHHADHCDPKTLGPLLAVAPRVKVLTSYKARNELQATGVDVGRVEVPPVGQSVALGDTLTVTPIPAAHYTHEPNDLGQPAYLGFIVQLNGVTLYHSGDTIIYPGMLDYLKQHAIDIACLPINGRDWFREQKSIVGNMDYREAAELAVAAGVRVLIPAHNDMFQGNRINPAYLLDYLAARHPQQRVHFLQPGELYYYVSS